MRAAYGDTLAFTSSYEIDVARKALDACARDPIIHVLEKGTLPGGGYAYLEEDFALIALREFMTVAKLNAAEPPYDKCDFPLRSNIENLLLSNEVYSLLEDYEVSEKDDPFARHVTRIINLTSQRKPIEQDLVQVPHQPMRRWRLIKPSTKL